MTFAFPICVVIYIMILPIAFKEAFTQYTNEMNFLKASYLDDQKSRRKPACRKASFIDQIDTAVRVARIFKRLWSPRIDSKEGISPAYVQLYGIFTTIASLKGASRETHIYWRFKKHAVDPIRFCCKL